MTDQTEARLLAAAIRTLRFLESQGTGRMAKVPAAVDLREAIIEAQGYYTSAAEELAAEFESMRTRLEDEARRAGLTKE